MLKPIQDHLNMIYVYVINVQSLRYKFVAIQLGQLNILKVRPSWTSTENRNVPTNQ
jgi:hypothetical protein